MGAPVLARITQITSLGCQQPACAPPPPATQAWSPRAKCPVSLMQTAQGEESLVQMDEQWLPGENRESAEGGWGGGRQTLKLALRKQRRGTNAQRWRPLLGGHPGATRELPRSLQPLRLPPAPAPGAGPTQQKGRAPSWKQDQGARRAS